MKIDFEYNDNKLVLFYDDKTGVLSEVYNTVNDKNMMVEYTQEGSGIVQRQTNGYVDMDGCEAVYVRIIDLDVFVPKFIFIKNIFIKKSETK